jgi:hypothetical protein
MWRRWLKFLDDAWQQQPVLVLSIALGTFGVLGPLVVHKERPDRIRERERVRDAESMEGL